MDGNKILPGAEGTWAALDWKSHPLAIATAAGCVLIVITELTGHLPNGFGGAIVTCLALVFLVIGSSAFLRRRRDKTKASRSDSSVLIADTEAFLSGDYATYLKKRRRDVPGWAWLNSFAHGELTTLRVTQQSRQLVSASRLAGAEKAWSQAQSIMGRDLLRIVQDDPQRLMLVQQSILVPLELRLMELETNSCLTAYDLVQATRAALRPRTS